MKKRLSKTDLIFIVILFACLILGAVWFYTVFSEKGGQVQITVDGEVYGIYDLSVEQEIPICIEEKTTNILVIKNGVADMVEADCPDKLCVHQHSISRNGESIVCLPNKIVVQVIHSEESEFDSIAK